MYTLLSSLHVSHSLGVHMFLCVEIIAWQTHLPKYQDLTLGEDRCIYMGISAFDIDAKLQNPVLFWNHRKNR